MDAAGIERAHLIGNSMGGRVAFEVGFRNARPGRPDRRADARRCAWLRDRPWTPLVKALRPELGLIQITPRPVIEQAVRRFVPGGRDGWSAVGVDEFLRAYMQPRGRAAFYAALRNIYLDEPEGDEGFWTRLRALEHESLFVWGQKDRLVPIAFARHVREALPGARHVELDCGHVPQLEAPRETHAAISRFLKGALAAPCGADALRPHDPPPVRQLDPRAELRAPRADAHDALEGPPPVARQPLLPAHEVHPANEPCAAAHDAHPRPAGVPAAGRAAAAAAALGARRSGRTPPPPPAAATRSRSATSPPSVPTYAVPSGPSVIGA